MRYDSAHSSNSTAQSRANQLSMYGAYVSYLRKASSGSGSYVVVIPSEYEDEYLQAYPQRTDLRDMFE